MDFYRSTESSVSPRLIQYRGADLWCDVSTGAIRPIIPAALTRDVFNALHNLSHAGPRPTLRAVADRFVWRGMRRDVRQWCRECHPCQSSKIARHTRAPLHHFPPPERRFGDVHVDLVGPLPPSEGHCYLFTIIDRFSRWPEAVPLVDATAASCVRAMLRVWISLSLIHI